MPKGYATTELLDQRRQQMDAATAALNAATAKVGEAEHALDAAHLDVELYKVNIADNALVAPHDGRIEYRVANVGEVLAAGGKVFTMLDTAYVYSNLAWHGLAATTLRLKPGPEGGAATLLAGIADRADLLVMGGYGHSRVREWVFGGFTQLVLADAPLPVMIAH